MRQHDRRDDGRTRRTPSTSMRVLVAGASIAGPALAYWLHRYGYEVVVLERASALRTGGQNIDIRGAGREVIRRMDLEGAVRARTTGEVGTEFIGEGGRVVASFPAGRTDSGGATGEVEILRGDLCQLLVRQTEGQAGVEYRFGDQVTGLTDHPDRVDVRFEHGPDEAFDLVVTADGIRSTTRDLIFGDEVEVRGLELEISYGTIPRIDSDLDWWRWYNAPGGRSVTLRPDRHFGGPRTVRATLSVIGWPPDLDRDDSSQRLAWLRSTFADAGWEAERVLEGFAASDDLYSESVGQVRAPRWSTGRVAMVGDAAYCASPISGMGTSLALVGAYVLAGELAAHVDHRDAFAGYERILRPYVEQAQDLPPGTPRLANPQTRAGIAAFHLALRIASAKPLAPVRERLFAPPAEKIDLPDYAHLLTL